jgi:hypothetical protein
MRMLPHSRATGPAGGNHSMGWQRASQQLSGRSDARMERELAARMCMDTGEQVVAKLGLQSQVTPLGARCVMYASCRPLLSVDG